MNAAISVIIGALSWTLSYTIVSPECLNSTTCVTTTVLYGKIILTYGCSFGVLFSIVIFLFIKRLPDKVQDDDGDDY